MNARTLVTFAATAALTSFPSAQAVPGVPARAAAVGQASPAFQDRWLVALRADASAHEAFLRDLAELRHTGEAAAFEARLAQGRAAQAPLRAKIEALATGLGARPIDWLWLTNTLVIEDASGASIEALRAHPDVLRATPDRLASPQLAVATDAQHHDSQGANQIVIAGVPLKGKGITLAIIDSGIDASSGATGRPHAAFFVNGDPTNPSGGGIGGSRILSSVGTQAFGSVAAEDVHGHGTRVASIAAGAKWASLPDVANGPAGDASIRSFRIDSTAQPGIASVFSMAAAFGQAAAHSDVRVANMSYDGSPQLDFEPNDAVDAASMAGVLVTLSAGNVGPSLTFAHGCYNAIVVGAADVDQKKPYAEPGFQTSAIGPLADGRRYPHLLGVGEAVTCAKLDDELSSIDSYGTSAGSALTAGTAALLFQAKPTLTQLQAKALLLNTAETVTLGDPNAAGWGYLRSKAAAEAALAGGVASAVANPTQMAIWIVPLTVGQAYSATLVWNRESLALVGPGEADVADLDLRVVDPFGQVVASSLSSVDNVEQVRLTAAVAGTYQVQVLPTAIDTSGLTAFALAGASGVPIRRPFDCTGGAPVLQGISPGQVEDSSPVGLTVLHLKGCNLLGTTAVTVGGTAASFVVKSDHAVDFTLPSGLTPGGVPVDLTTPAGTAQIALLVIGAGPTLATPNFNVWAGIPFTMLVWSKPGDLFVAVASTSLSPTSLAGIVDLAIGAQGADLVLMQVGKVPPGGVFGEQYFYSGGLPIGTVLLFQAAVIDGAAPALPATATNVDSLLVIIHA